MKFIAIFFAVILALVGLSSAIICAKDSTYQNFRDRAAMERYNEQSGSSKYLE